MIGKTVNDREKEQLRRENEAMKADTKKLEKSNLELFSRITQQDLELAVIKNKLAKVQKDAKDWEGKYEKKSKEAEVNYKNWQWLKNTFDSKLDRQCAEIMSKVMNISVEKAQTLMDNTTGVSKGGRKM